MDVRKGKHSIRLIEFSQFFKTLLIGILFLSAIYAVNQINLARCFPISSVKVYGVNHVDQREVEQILLPLVKRGFFAVDVESIRDRLMQIPWVADIFVRRNWPGQIEVTIVERSAIAKWNDEGLLSTAGEIFYPLATTYPNDLPTLTGPTGGHVTMLKYLQEINRELEPLHTKISALELSAYLTWKITLDNGIVLQMGHKDVLTRLHHFVKVYSNVVGNRAGEVDYIDLRYPNGVAVRWKETAKT